MTYVDGLAYRVRRILESRGDLEEAGMFGGIGQMLDGDLVCGIHDDVLLARLAPNAYEDALAEPDAREMDFTGKPMCGLVFVDPPGMATGEALEAWLDRCLEFVGSLPPK